MFGTSKEMLLKHLENLRKRVCCYATPDYCDCKYGIPWEDMPEKDDPDCEAKMLARMNQWQSFGSKLGEQTGCPELRQAIALIKEIPDEEFGQRNADVGTVLFDDLEALGVKPDV